MCDVFDFFETVTDYFTFKIASLLY